MEYMEYKKQQKEGWQQRGCKMKGIKQYKIGKAEYQVLYSKFHWNTVKFTGKQ